MYLQVYILICLQIYLQVCLQKYLADIWSGISHMYRKYSQTYLQIYLSIHLQIYLEIYLVPVCRVRYLYACLKGHMVIFVYVHTLYIHMCLYILHFLVSLVHRNYEGRACTHNFMLGIALGP